jgi:hypothetical protein
MITVKLLGGLGNQMFQYAAGRRLALKHRSQLRLDLSDFDNSAHATQRHYELDCFKVIADITKQNLEAEFSEAKKTWRGQLKLQPSVIIREPHLNFYKPLLNAPDDVYLVGYWQSEQYFKDIRTQLLKDFVYASPPNQKNLTILELIKAQKNPVSLHVRRGDYVHDKSTSQFHGTKTTDYYNQAIDYVASQLDTLHLFVFSDEPEWCRKNLKFNHPTTFISHNKAGSEDMRLMRACKHFIIANSSFSWWGAWLAESPQKLVVAPRQWFNDPSANASDIVPESWYRI